MRPPKATIWSLPASGTLQAVNQTGDLENLMLVDGDRQPPSWSTPHRVDDARPCEKRPCSLDSAAPKTTHAAVFANSADPSKPDGTRRA